MTEPIYQNIFQTPKDAHYFFGYYNKPQISADDSTLLALRVLAIDRLPDKNDEAEVGWFDLKSGDNRFHAIAKTTAYNWQQGSMLQFLGPDFTSRVIWNTFEDGSYCSKIYDFRDQSVTTQSAIYDVSKDGVTATVIDFERHTWCRRGYSYGNTHVNEKNKPVVTGDGIWKVDLSTGKKHQIISIEDMIGHAPLNTMDGAIHYLEHMLFNHNGQLFAFLHRWRHVNGIHSRLCVVDRDGKSIRIINDSGRMSHYCWLSNHEILAYGALPNRINALRKKRGLVRTLFKWLMPIYRKLIHDQTKLSKHLTGDSYIIMNIENPKLNKNILPELRLSDGHPTMMEDGNHVFTDTYARSSIGEKPKLIRADVRTGKAELIDELNSIDALDETPLRCDLHPRLSPSGNIISIDTMNDGMRSCYAYLDRKSVV